MSKNFEIELDEATAAFLERELERAGFATASDFVSLTIKLYEVNAAAASSGDIDLTTLVNEAEDDIRAGRAYSLDVAEVPEFLDCVLEEAEQLRQRNA